MSNVRNTSGLEPLGRAVLVEMVGLNEAKDAMVVIPENVRRSTATMDEKAEVVAVGPICWEDESVPRAVPGDKVIITRFAGYTIAGPADGKIYRLVNDRDLFCKITKEKRDE